MNSRHGADYAYAEFRVREISATRVRKTPTVDDPETRALGFPGLVKRSWALRGRNLTRNSQAFAEAMGSMGLGVCKYDPSPSAVTRKVPLGGTRAFCTVCPPPNTCSHPLRGHIAEAMPCLKKSRGSWGQSPQRHREGAFAFCPLTTYGHRESLYKARGEDFNGQGRGEVATVRNRSPWAV